MLVLLGLRAFLTAPVHQLQRLDSPNGKIDAALNRVTHVGDHFEIEARQGASWDHLLTTDRMEMDPVVDLHERIIWADDSSRLYFTLEHRLVWGYDFSKETGLGTAELQKDLQRFRNLAFLKHIIESETDE